MTRGCAAARPAPTTRTPPAPLAVLTSGWSPVPTPTGPNTRPTRSPPCTDRCGRPRGAPDGRPGDSRRRVGPHLPRPRRLDPPPHLGDLLASPVPRTTNTAQPGL